MRNSRSSDSFPLIPGQRNPHTQKICLGESSVIEDDLRGEAGAEWAGGGGGGGGATYIYKVTEETACCSRVACPSAHADRHQRGL